MSGRSVAIFPEDVTAPAALNATFWLVYVQSLSRKHQDVPPHGLAKLVTASPKGTPRKGVHLLFAQRHRLRRSAWRSAEGARLRAFTSLAHRWRNACDLEFGDPADPKLLAFKVQ
jgi:hypothetical protein